MEKNTELLCFRKLKRLNLGGNDLTAVPQKALALLENLKKLEMQENRIATITEGDFAGNVFLFVVYFLLNQFVYSVDLSLYPMDGAWMFYEKGWPVISHMCL